MIICCKNRIYLNISLKCSYFLSFPHFFFFLFYLLFIISPLSPIYAGNPVLCYNILYSCILIIERIDHLKEKLYTIPVTDAFHEDTECPLCSMYHELEKQSIEYTMGPSYMEDDTRAETDKTGFCRHHIKMMYQNQNRLGIALILDTHMDEVMKRIESLSKHAKISGGSIFKKPAYTDVKSYIDYLEANCFVCSRIHQTFERYLATIFYLYKTEADFKTTFASSKGFCTKHYGMLYQMAGSYLNGKLLECFITDLNKLYLENMKRVKEDLEWFRDKFDYRNQDAPWKNSRDAVPRSILKINSVLEEDL